MAQALGETSLPCAGLRHYSASCMRPTTPRVMARRDRIIATGQTLIAEKDEKEALY